ncbi:hypothetical protein ES703_104678 [subsurface metagenome]
MIAQEQHLPEIAGAKMSNDKIDIREVPGHRMKLKGVGEAQVRIVAQ